jgi:hypothetical protein
MKFMLGLFKKTKPGIDLNAPLSPTADKYLGEATAEFNIKQEALRQDWRLDSFARWAYDDQKGVLTLSFSDGAELQADGQLLGTYSPQGRSFEWAWNSPHFGDAITQGSKMVKKVGEQLGIAYLHTGMVPVPSDIFLSYYVAIGAKATDSAGIFRADGGGVDVLVAVKNMRWTKTAA